MFYVSVEFSMAQSLLVKMDAISMIWMTGKHLALTAILIIGDLIYAGILPMPSPLDWGKFIEKVSKGALDGMIMLGLIDEDTTVPQAFADLYDFVNGVLTPEEKSAMTYDVLMSEHSLCKYKHLYSRGKK
jgi:hypothetical protein